MPEVSTGRAYDRLGKYNVKLPKDAAMEILHRMGGWKPDPSQEGVELRRHPLDYQELRATSKPAWDRLRRQEGANPVGNIMAFAGDEKVHYRDRATSEDPETRSHEAIHIAQHRGLTTPGEAKVRSRVGKYASPFMRQLGEADPKLGEFDEREAAQFPATVFSAPHSTVEEWDAYMPKPGQIDEAQPQPVGLPPRAQELDQFQSYMDELRWLNPEPQQERGLRTFESAVDPKLMQEYLKRRPLAPMRPHPKMSQVNPLSGEELGY